MEFKNLCKLIGYCPEPAYFLFSLILGVYAVVGQAFLTYRLCLLYREEQGDDQGSIICSKTKNYTDRDIIQAQAADYAIYGQITNCAPALISSVFIGVWSDIYGRKLPMLISLAGFTAQGFLMVLLATFDYLPIWLMFLGNVLAATTGQVVILYACMFSMVTDVVTDRNARTIRLGIMSGLAAVAIVIGSLVAGEIDKLSDRPFVYNYLFILCCTAAAFLYCICIINETLHLRVKNDDNQEIETYDSESGVTSTSTNNKNDSNNINSTGESVEQSKSISSCGSILSDFFQILTIPRKGRNRLHLNLCILCFMLTFMADVGMSGLFYLYLTNAPFYLTDTNYSYLVAIQTSLAGLGVFLIPPFYKRVFHFEDTSLIITSLIFSMTKAFIVAFAHDVYMIYLGSACCFATAIMFTGYRSFCSKLVGHGETGRLFSFISSVELIGPLLSGLIFNIIYSETLEIFAGFVWIVGGTILSLVFILICWVHIDYNKNLPLLINVNDLNKGDDEEDLLESE